MESRLGHDFSRIRVHTDARAAESARAVGALAYTVGRDIAFAEGQFRPHSEPGRRLLAHELVHTLQQHRLAGSPASVDSGGLRISQPNDRAEVEAAAVAAQLHASASWRRKPTRLDPASLSGRELVLARSVVPPPRKTCADIPRSLCNGTIPCGYGGRCWWVKLPGKEGECKCLGQSKPSPGWVLTVLAILGLSAGLLVTVMAALADPEPATKLGLAGLTAKEAALLLSLLGIEALASSAPAEARPGGAGPEGL
jgi:hypothetical protein